MPLRPPRIAARPAALLLLVAAMVLGPGLSDGLAAASHDDVAGPQVETSDPGVAAATLAPQALVQFDLVRTIGGVDGRGPDNAALVIRPEPVPAATTACGDASGVTGCAASNIGAYEHRRPRLNMVAASLSAEFVAAAAAIPARPRWAGGLNLFRATAFVTQKEYKWCVAASVQMMVNIVRKRTDRTAATQKLMIAYAQSNDHGPWGPGGGTDVTGWIVALQHFGAGRYRAVGARTPAQALRIAAIAMRQTGRPAGMLVMDGQHAWVLNGFESRTDPKADRWARITSVRVSGPLYPIQRKNGYDLPPNTRLSVRALARYFHPSTVGHLVGRYVVIVPSH